MSDKITMDETGALTGGSLHAWEDAQEERWHPDVEVLGAEAATTKAFVYAGHWAADCIGELCYGAEMLACCGGCVYHGPGKRGALRTPEILCPSCGRTSRVQWPDDAEELDRLLAARPVPGVRNWAPGGHRQAVVPSSEGEAHPMGQTAEDLRLENIARNWSA